MHVFVKKILNQNFKMRKHPTQTIKRPSNRTHPLQRHNFHPFDIRTTTLTVHPAHNDEDRKRHRREAPDHPGVGDRERNPGVGRLVSERSGGGIFRIPGRTDGGVDFVVWEDAIRGWSGRGGEFCRGDVVEGHVHREVVFVRHCSLSYCFSGV